MASHGLKRIRFRGSDFSAHTPRQPVPTITASPAASPPLATRVRKVLSVRGDGQIFWHCQKSDL